MDDGATQTRSDHERLAIEQERISLALEAAHMGEYEWDLRQDLLIVSPRAAAITGLPEGTMPALGGEVLRPVLHPADNSGFYDDLEGRVAAEGRREIEVLITRQDNGKPVWVRLSAVSKTDETGAVVRVIGVVQDITERRTEDDARNALVAELDHRVKNVLASVQSLAAQSARKTTSLEAFLKTFAGRLDAMASAHALLTATRWRGADIGHIAAAELGGLAPGQARWSGPEIVLNPRATNALTLALHELATNAVKFGALSVDTGRIEVTWHPRAEGGFELDWVERGGPSVKEPERHGFGATLLERVTGRELGGQARLEFRPDGVRAHIVADATALPREARPIVIPPRETAPAADAQGASAGAATPDGVRGRRIIIVEDAVLLALELEAGLVEAGASVIGTAADIPEALKLAEAAFDVAVLDANLNGVPVTPVAELLRAKGKRFIFATGYGDTAPAPEGFDAPVVRKPYNVAQIAEAVAEALARG
jgi:PAS domain S-box-containing protein